MKTLTEHLICELSSATYKSAAERAAMRGDARANKFFNAWAKSINLEAMEHIAKDASRTDAPLINNLLREYDQILSPKKMDNNVVAYSVMNEHDTIFSFSVVNLDGKEMFIRPICTELKYLETNFHKISFEQLIGAKKERIKDYDDEGYCIPFDVCFKHKNTTFEANLCYLSDLDSFILFSMKDYRTNKYYSVSDFFIPSKVCREINTFIHTVNKDHKITSYLDLGSSKMTEEGEVR